MTRGRAGMTRGGAGMTRGGAGMTRRALLALPIVMAALSAAIPGVAHATFAGRNGAIIVTVNDFTKGQNKSRTIVRALSPTGGKARTLLNCLQYAGNCPAQVQRASISSDGKTIAFGGVYVTDSETFQSEIVVLHVGSTKLTTLPFTTTDSTEQDAWPALFPGTGGLVFQVANAAGPDGLYTEGITGASPHRIIACSCWDPAVPPLGASIAFDRGSGVWMSGADGSSPHAFATPGPRGIVFA